MNLNKAMLIGRLTKDPEGRTTPSGRSVTSFSMATNRVWNDAAGKKQEAAEYHNIVVWGKLAEIAAQYLVKGQEVFVEGRLQTRSWDAQDGTKRYTTEIVADNIQMGSKPGMGGGRAEGYSAPKSYNPQASFTAAPSAEPDFNQPATDGAAGISSYDPQVSSSAEGQQEAEIKIENIPF